MKNTANLTEDEITILQNMFEIYGVIAEQQKCYNYNIRDNLFYLKEKLNDTLGLELEYY